MTTHIEIEIHVELIAENQYGKLFRTSEGYHINGNRKKFIQNILRDIHSGDPMAVASARFVLFIINNFEEI